MEDNKLHRAGMAAVFSFVFNGLGQIYNGQLSKGFLIIFLSALSMLVLILGAVLLAFWISGRIQAPVVLIAGIGLFLLGLIFSCTIGMRSIADAYRGALEK